MRGRPDGSPEEDRHQTLALQMGPSNRGMRHIPKAAEEDRHQALSLQVRVGVSAGGRGQAPGTVPTGMFTFVCGAPGQAPGTVPTGTGAHEDRHQALSLRIGIANNEMLHDFIPLVFVKIFALENFWL